MKNVIIGTAGHVDHGKTCLIKALTGIDTDRLKEEKKRGITIENGFADLSLGEYNISIIDVPGHERFIKNMLMGIGGIDLVLLVIALDEGVMPQTVEHFQILSMLGIKRGIIVYTKKDMAQDEEWIELVKLDVKDMVAGSFLEDAPEIEVSAHTGYNIEQLKKIIVENIDDSNLKNNDKMLFRLPVDRVFTISGFGTVVTGTLIEGTVQAGDEVMIYPEEKPIKIRNLQVHNQQVEKAFAGQRTAINLGGIKKEEIERGTVLARKGSLETTMMLDVRLKLFSDTDKTILNNSRLHFYCGSSESLAKIVLLDREKAEKGESFYAQLRLEEKVAVKKGDRFIVRFYSPLLTIGGGKILEVRPRKHKRYDEEVLKNLEIKDKGNLVAVAELTIKEGQDKAPDRELLSAKLRLSMEETETVLSTLLEEKRIIQTKSKIIHEEYFSKVKDNALGILREYHGTHKLSEGMGKEEFKSKLEQITRINDRKLIDELVKLLVERSYVRVNETIIADASFEVTLTPQMKALQERILERYREKRFEIPTVEEVLADEKDKINGKHMIETLENQQKLIKLNYQFYIDAEAFHSALEGLKSIIADKGQITLGEFRDLIGTSRKFAMIILEYLDEKKITKKIDDSRILA